MRTVGAGCFSQSFFCLGAFWRLLLTSLLADPANQQRVRKRDLFIAFDFLQDSCSELQA